MPAPLDTPGRDGPAPVDSAPRTDDPEPGGRARPSPATSGASTGWDRLSEHGRRERLESMDAGAVRAMAASMPVIEQAKGILMGCFGCDPAAAFTVLVRASAARNLKLRDLAALVVDAVSVEHGGAQPGTRPLDRVRGVLSAGPGLLDDGRGYGA